DDHDMVRSGVRQLLEREFDVDVLGEAEHGLEAISLVAKVKPDILFLDIAMPYANGLEVIGEVRRLSPDTEIAVVTGMAASNVLGELWRAGVLGLISKATGTHEMQAGIADMLAGKRFISADLKPQVLGDLAHEGLSIRQMEILILVAQGHSNREIAEILSISPKTVDAHRTKMMSKLKVHSVAQLVLYAVREGLIDPTRS
ncbi:MAG: response regulator transcription factor, partial [Pseudomonadota bacterium]